MRLAVRHDTVYRYEDAPVQLALRLRLFAADSPMQRVEDWTVTVNGAPVEPLFANAFGDREAFWRSPEPVAEAVIAAEGVVETEDKAGVLGRAPPHRPAVFLRLTALTRPDAAIAEFAREVAAGGDEDRLALLHRLTERVADRVTYRKGATDNGATAAEALAQGEGVCQDQTHLFVSACRFLEAPARYVVGYLHDPEAPVLETHAWAEAWCGELGWVGFDPTHRRSPTDAYIRLGSGLDAHDAAPVRGHLQGAVPESLAVQVRIAAAGQ